MLDCCVDAYDDIKETNLKIKKKWKKIQSDSEYIDLCVVSSV